MKANNKKGEQKFSLFSLSKLITYSMINIYLFSVQNTLAVTFNPLFLENVEQGDTADLSVFEQPGSAQLPGKYRVSIYVNELSLGITQDVNFRLVEKKNGHKSLQPCLSLKELADYGVNVSAFPLLKKSKPADCLPFTDIIPMSAAHFDFEHLILQLSFPQASLQQSVAGYVDPALWDDGIPAILLNYHFSGNRQFKQHDALASNMQSDFLNLRSGINLGAWRLRNYSVWQHTSQGSQWQNINNYLERGINALRSRLTIGDTVTPADIFDSVQFRGVQLATDETMYPDSQRGYAPIIRGIAQSNAQVTIRQNGYSIYQTYVAPGPFTITDLYPTANSGDLEVIIKEADGTERKFIQPYAAIAIMQREGRVKYSISAGKTHSNGMHKAKFVEGNLIWGGPHGLTLYMGGIGADNYSALAAGFGKNLAYLGAVSADVTMATAHLLANEKSYTGQAYRFLYSKSFATMGTDLRLAGYRYATRHYYSFQEANSWDNWRDSNDKTSQGYHKRSELQATVNQQIAQYGSFYLTLSAQKYWGNSQSQRYFQAGYNGAYKMLSYGLSYSDSRTVDTDSVDRIFAMNMSLPVSTLLGREWGQDTWLSYNMNTSADSTQQQLSVSGSLLDDHNLTYNLQQSYGRHPNGYSANATANYKGTYANLNAGYYKTPNYQQVSYGINGGMILHRQGVTFSQSLADTVGLVKAPGAVGTRIMNNSGVRTDWHGYAIVPSITAYRQNNITLDPATLKNNVELLQTGKQLIPTKGAVVVANYPTRVGYRVLMVLQQHNRKVVPFGAVVTLKDDGSATPLSAIVGEAGQVFLTGLPLQGQLQVQWGDKQQQQCQINYQLPSNQQQDLLVWQLGEAQICQQ